MIQGKSTCLSWSSEWVCSNLIALIFGMCLSCRFEENLCLATTKDDSVWSAFVYWCAQSLIYAEENDIAQWDSNQMPLVQIFGPQLQRMFRDTVHVVGNYGEIYNRHLSNILVRSGRNRLNKMEDKGPRRYLPPLHPPS